MKHPGTSLKQEIADFVSGAWLRPPTAQQVAALCWRRACKGHEVLLVTTRGRGQWMVPKGWPKTDTPDAEMAGVEAYEEAGVRGSVSPDPVGRFHFEKRIGPGTVMECVATVYALEVSGLDPEFPRIRPATDWLVFACRGSGQSVIARAERPADPFRTLNAARSPENSA